MKFTHKLKEGDHLAVTIAVFFGFWFCMHMAELGRQRKVEKQTAYMLEKIDRQLKERHRLDSLYMDHISTCSFIDRHNVVVGNDGYLRTMYYEGRAHSAH